MVQERPFSNLSRQSRRTSEHMTMIEVQSSGRRDRKEAREEVDDDAVSPPGMPLSKERKARGETAFWSKGKDKLVWTE